MVNVGVGGEVDVAGVAGSMSSRPEVQSRMARLGWSRCACHAAAAAVASGERRRSGGGAEMTAPVPSRSSRAGRSLPLGQRSPAAMMMAGWSGWPNPLPESQWAECGGVAETSCDDRPGGDLGGDGRPVG